MEKNYKILSSALKDLPEYQPGDFWTKIEDELAIRESCEKLPLYTPPSLSWERIDSDLSHAESHKYSKKPILRVLIRYAAAAAVLILGLAILIFIHHQKNKITFSEELVTENDIGQWNREDIEIDQALNLYCDLNPVVCRSDEFRKLKKELDFLSESKLNVENHMNLYDDNKEKELLLTKIELERNEIINQMLTLAE